jgi:hypothetical protein
LEAETRVLKFEGERDFEAARVLLKLLELCSDGGSRLLQEVDIFCKKKW